MSHREHHHDHPEEMGGDLLDRGLAFDLAVLRDRRAVLGLLGAGAAAGVGGAMLLGGSAAAGTALAGRGSCSGEEIPTETAGPYPGDGSNGPDVLSQSGVVRRDIRTSIGDASGTASGVRNKIVLTLVDTDGCTPLEGLAVYLWHCTADGKYSMYSQGITSENYLRGVQVSDAHGKVRFTSIYPGCYSGRWPHIHFEVYGSVDDATGGGDPMVTSQIAMPRAPSSRIYRKADGYGDSERNLNQISLSSDNVFGDDGGIHQLGTVTGSISKGMRTRLQVPVDA